MAYNTVIETKELTKIYRLYRKPSDRLREALSFGRDSFHVDFYALNKVNFSAQKGETIGIIGRNGSGKSTLLKILSGIAFPTSGAFRAEGRISALLELGAGFNPEMSGIENIFFTGTLQGYSRREIEERIPFIADFADIGEYIYQPVKTYSSGMFVRLAFAVSVNIHPNIFLVDEALAVGDIAFQARCFKKMRELQESGTTIIFVSHALDTVIRYCNKAILMDKGKITFSGAAKEAVDMYKCLIAKCVPDENAPRSSDISEQISTDTLSYGSGKAEITKLELLDENFMPVITLFNGKLFSIKMSIKFKANLKKPIFAFTIKDIKGLEITGTNTMFKNVSTCDYKAGEEVTVEFKQKLNCQSGRYALSVGCVGYDDNGALEVYHRLYDAIYFEVVSMEPMVGFFDLNSEITIKRS
jgi:teichoic acid transport system ATP-binding protein